MLLSAVAPLPRAPNRALVVPEEYTYTFAMYSIYRRNRGAPDRKGSK